MGRVSNTHYLITFQGKSVESTKQDFKDAVNEYIGWCKKYGKIPEKGECATSCLLGQSSVYEGSDGSGSFRVPRLRLCQKTYHFSTILSV
jgi:hypothetical protein